MTHLPESLHEWLCLMGVDAVIESSSGYTIVGFRPLAAALFWCLPMLLTSPEDNGSSLPVESLQQLPSSRVLEGQRIESDRAPAPSSLEICVDEHRAPSQPKEALFSSGMQPHAETAARPAGLPSTKEMRPITPQSLRQTVRSTAPSQASDLDGLYALRQAAALQARRQSHPRLWSKRSLAVLTDVSAAELIALGSFAAPLSPLRERDLAALSEFFQQDEMLAIEADINQRLLSLLPEPCWEEEVFDFLKEFL